MKSFLIFLIQIYCKISDLMGSIGVPSGDCRFSPTCSRYAEEAITKHGTVKGSVMTVYRIIRCNPFYEGGEDPVK